MAGKHQKMYFSFFKIALFVLPIIGIVGHVNLAVTMLGNVAHTDSAQFHICMTGIFKQLIETAPNCAEAKQPYT